MGRRRHTEAIMKSADGVRELHNSGPNRWIAYFDLCVIPKPRHVLEWGAVLALTSLVPGLAVLLIHSLERRQRLFVFSNKTGDIGEPA